MNKITTSNMELLIASSSFMLLTGNWTFFGTLLDIYPFGDNVLFVTSVFAITFLAILLLLILLSLFLPTRFVISFCLLAAAASGYFSGNYGIVIDDIMIQNVMETDLAETSDLLNPSYLSRLFFLAIVPIGLIFYFKKIKKSFLKKFFTKTAVAIGALAISVAIIFLSSDQFASFFREHKSVRYFINPVYPMYSLGQYITKTYIDTDQNVFKESGITSKIESDDEGRELTILVVGETARADHFSLNGYERETNPLLAQEPTLITFSDVMSCGTSTAISVPCLFSLQHKDEFDVSQAKYHENVIDLLHKAGVSVLWRDNNSDSKGVADRVEFQDYKTSTLNTKCDDECRDIGMLEGLQEYIDQQTGDVLIVLHMMGSHGPAYFERYPREFAKFQPECKTLELSECSLEEIRNAYDNTILYTDYFLSNIIKLLKNNVDKYEPVMFYISDHGESLGENGLYLHGLPYLIAPDTQKKVAMLVWGANESDLDLERTRATSGKSYTHDSIASTLLELFEIETDQPVKNVDEAPIYLKAEEDE